LIIVLRNDIIAEKSTVNGKLFHMTRDAQQINCYECSTCSRPNTPYTFCTNTLYIHQWSQHLIAHY